MHEFNNELLKIKAAKDEYDSELMKEEVAKKPKIDPKEIVHSVFQNKLAK